MTLQMDDLLSPKSPINDPAFPERGQRGIQSIEVGGEILKVLASQPRPMAMRELVRGAGMPSGKIHPYLVSFAKIGLVSQDPLTGHYKVGPMAIRLGLNGLQTLNPIREAAPFAEALANETMHNVAMIVWGDLGPVVVQMFDGPYPLHTNMRIGSPMSLTGTATGRLFAAFMPRAVIDRFLLDDRNGMGLDLNEKLGDKTVAELIQEAREHRMSHGFNYPSPGVAAFSAPVFDYTGKMALAITISGSTRTFDTRWDGAVAKALRQSTDTISERLGAHVDALAPHA